MMDDFNNWINNPYLKENIIAYLGNKRNLLALIHKALKYCHIDKEKLEFIDLFSGSGVVARFAKLQGFKKVIANDWEYYSYVLNMAYLKTQASDLDHYFKELGGLEKILERLNHSLCKTPYISLYYSPHTDNENDIHYGKERLFYSKSNGEKIDAMREEIERLYPYSDSDLSEQQRNEKFLLIALLLYEASTHTNTSGVFKAYHKRFGGYAGNARNRILQMIELKTPFLIQSQSQIEVYKEDAFKLIKDLSLGDSSVVYLDPPYKEHQYGSNYHMLNTIARWDKIPAPLALDKKGELEHKAGIRSDWVNTKSDYCYKSKATTSFKNLILLIEARYILVSYSTDGIIPFVDLCSTLCSKGHVEIILNEYITYRGGRKSLGRANKNFEFILIVDTHKKAKPSCMKKLMNILDYKEIFFLLEKPFHREKLAQIGFLNKENILILKEPNLSIQSKYCFYLLPDFLREQKDRKSITQLKRILKNCVCESIEDELKEIDHILGGSLSDTKEIKFFLKEWKRALKSLAYKKTKLKFKGWVQKGKKYKEWYPKEYQLLEKHIQELQRIFELRVK